MACRAGGFALAEAATRARGVLVGIPATFPNPPSPFPRRPTHQTPQVVFHPDEDEDEGEGGF